MHLLADSNDAAVLGITCFVLLIEFALIAIMLVGLWKVFVKAGEPGWAAIIPIYNIVVLVKISGKPIWWIVLFFIPIVSIVAAIMIMLAIAQSFGRSAGFAIGLVFLPFIFWPILGFGDSQYVGTKSF